MRSSRSFNNAIFEFVVAEPSWYIIHFARPVMVSANHEADVL
jgi:hypothetical protein